MTSTDVTPYDVVLYPGYALAQAHPDRLATLATLLGMAPTDVPHSRVLEIGCGDGLNLISVALGLPEAVCVGIDSAAAGIRKGQDFAKKLDLKNITLRQLNIMEVGRDFGKFDFIIAHGVYSWVPEEVRDHLLSICSDNLAENGVAYVSYNTYPGGHLVTMVSDMMRYHVSEFAEPAQRVEQARALISFLAESSSEPDGYRMILQKEWSRIKEYRDSSLFHDDLSDCNVPVYFYQFVEHAARHRLKYLSEAHFFETQAGSFPPQVVEVLNRISDSRIAKEQYLDFLKCRRFRQTLLCHATQELDYALAPEKMVHFYIASPIRPEQAELDLRSKEAALFLGPKNSSIKTDNPLIKAAMLRLGEAWPRALHFHELLAAARTACRAAAGDGPDIEEDARALGDMLLRAYAGLIVEFHVYPPRFVLQAGERPVASPLARLQIQSAGEVTNLRHYTLGVEPGLGRYLIQLLDGSRDRSALVNDLAKLVAAGTVTMQKDGAPVSDPGTARELIAADLEQKLTELGQMALLIG